MATAPLSLFGPPPAAAPGDGTAPPGTGPQGLGGPPRPRQGVLPMAMPPRDGQAAAVAGLPVPGTATGRAYLLRTAAHDGAAAVAALVLLLDTVDNERTRDRLRHARADLLRAAAHIDWVLGDNQTGDQ